MRTVSELQEKDEYEPVRIDNVFSNEYEFSIEYEINGDRNKTRSMN